MRVLITVLALLLALSERAHGQQGTSAPAEPANDPDAQTSVPATFQLSGDFLTYGLRDSHAYFGQRSRTWMENSLALKGQFAKRGWKAGVTLLVVKTTGRDPFGTGTGTPGESPSKAHPDAWPEVDIDQAYIAFNLHGTTPTTITVGRQHLVVGSQFVVGDGVYDGFSPQDRQAVYHNPRRGFDAVRIERVSKTTRVDAFVFRVHPTWDAGGGSDGLFGGVDVTRTIAHIGGTYAGGLFYRRSGSDLDNDMTVLNLRGEQSLGDARFYLSGEAVGEVAGRCRNGVYCTRVGQRMNELAGHAELGYRSSTRAKPFAEIGYVYYSKDFTPIATGFSEWGKWYLGNQIDWIVFGTNTRVVRAQAGFSPHAGVVLRGLYHNTREAVPSAGGTLSNEVSLIAEWYPSNAVWINVLLGDSRPGHALEASGLQNPFAALNSGAATVGTVRSTSLAIATGVKF